MQITKLTPELMVDDMQKTLKFYKELLGFNVTVSVPDEDPFFVILANGDVNIMLYKREQFAEEIPAFKTQSMGGSVALYIGIDNIEEVYKNLSDKVDVIQPLHKTNYGTTEFSFEDCNGYILMLTSV